MTKMINILKYLALYNKTKNPIKKLYYSIRIKLCLNDMHKYIFDKSLYEILVEFSIVFHDVKEIQSPSVLMIYRSDDLSRYKINMAFEGDIISATLETDHPDKGIDFVYNGKDTNYHCTIPYDSEANENNYVSFYNKLARVVIENAVSVFCDSILSKGK